MLPSPRVGGALSAHSLNCIGLGQACQSARSTISSIVRLLLFSVTRKVGVGNRRPADALCSPVLCSKLFQLCSQTAGKTPARRNCVSRRESPKKPRFVTLTHYRGLPPSLTYRAVIGESRKALPDDIPGFAALGEAGDAAGGVAEEDFAVAGLAGDEEDVRRFG